MRHELIAEMPRHRWTLRRMVLMYVPLTIGALTLTTISLLALLGGSVGAIIPLSILLIITAAVAYQAVAAVRDLRASPTFSRGEVLRTWSKGGLLFFFRSHYVMVERDVFVMEPTTWVQIQESDVIECHHWPHTKTLIRIVLLRGDDTELRPDEPVIPIETPMELDTAEHGR